jgi:hypothetical protein
MTTDRELDRALRDLPPTIDPGADLWPEIAARIESGRGRRRRISLGLALAAAATLVAVWRLAPRPVEPEAAPAAAPPTRIAIAPAEPATPPATAAPADVIAGEQALRAAAGQLASAYDRRRPLLDRALLAVYDENLQIVDAAIRDSRAALVESPDDPALARLLDRAYHHKLALLLRASGERDVP